MKNRRSKEVTDKVSIALTIIGSIVLPLAITTLSMASNYGGMQETLNITAKQTSMILEQQTQLVNSISELKQADAIKSVKIEDINQRLVSVMAMNNTAFRDYKSERESSLRELIRMREEDRKLLQQTQKEVYELNIKIAKLTK